MRDQLITSTSDTWQEESLHNYRPLLKPDLPAGYELKGGKGGVAKRLSRDGGQIDNSQIDLDSLPQELGLELPSNGTYSELTNGQVLHLQSYVCQCGCDLHQVAKDSNCLFNVMR